MRIPGTTVVGGGFTVLEDPTGTRVRWMRRAGRVVFLLFLCWLLVIVLGGLGLVPVAAIPFAHVMRPSHGPPPLAKLPEPRMPSASDLRRALPANVSAARAASVAGQAQQVRLAGPKTTPAVRVSPGKSASAPGKTKTAPALPAARGQSSAAPGRTKTTPALKVSPGKSATAPGKTKTTPAPSAARGRSSAAPGRTKTAPTSVRKSKKP